MADKLKKSDKVEWETWQGKNSGSVKKKLTEPIDIKSHHVASSKENPQYLVENEKSGGQAAHKPETLKKTQAKTSKIREKSKLLF